MYFLIGLAISSITVLITNSILPLLGTNKYNQLGPLSTIFLTSFLTYSIVKHRLFDIRIIISRSFATLIALSIYTLCYFGTQFIFSKFSLFHLEPFSNFIFFVVSVISFNSLRLFIQTTAEITFLKTTHDYQKMALEFSELLSNVSDFQHLQDQLSKGFLTILNIRSFNFYIPDHPHQLLAKKEFICQFHSNEFAKPIPVSHPLIQYFSRPDAAIIYIHDDSEWSHYLHEFNAIIAVPCKKKTSLYGFFFVEEKLSEDPYTVYDFTLFQTIASQICSTLERIRPFEQIKGAYEKSLLATERISQQATYATLTKGIAHEIRNPLGMCISGLELMLTYLDDPQRIKNYAELTLKSMTRLSKITTTMLKYGSFSSNKLISVTATELIDDILVATSAEIREKAIQVTKDIDDTLSITCDQGSINQVLLNLVLNAVQAMNPQGKLSISVSKDSYISETGNTLLGCKFEIRDTGPGIEKDNLKTIFDPFYTTKYQNTGLGLSIALRIVTQHNGIIFAESEKGRYTNMVVYLPL